MHMSSKGMNPDNHKFHDLLVTHKTRRVDTLIAYVCFFFFL